MKQRFTLLGIILLCILWFEIPQTHAQVSLGLALQYQPLEENHEAAGYRFGWGGALEVLSSPIKGEIPVQLMGGIQFNYLHGGREQRDIPTFLPDEDDIKAIVKNYQLGIQGFVRMAAPEYFKLRPYIDLIGGMGYYAVEETIRRKGIQWDGDERTVDNFVVTRNFKPRIGAGTGLLLQVSNYIDLDIRVSYLHTGKIDHVDLESVENDGEFIEYDINRTRVNPWNFQVGVRVLVE